MMTERIIRVGILGLVLLLGGLAEPQEVRGYSICATCVGWDGPGLGSASLYYHFGAFTHDNGLTDRLVKETVLAAMKSWSRAADIRWVETPQAGRSRSVDTGWSTGTYGPWGTRFPSTALAVGFYPTPQNFDPIAGDVYFNDAQTWSINGGPGYDIFSVALHELGHALGLGHSSDSRAVMYPYYHRVTGLTADDLAGIRSLYAAPGPTGGSFAALETPTSAAVPEPGTLLLLGLGLAGLGVWKAAGRRLLQREIEFQQTV